MTLRALAAALLLLVPAALLAGCASCSPVDVPTQVPMTLADEEVRTLPILASGETRVAGQEVPDSHGRLEFHVNVTHEGLDNQSLAFKDVDVSDLTLRVEVAGRGIPIKVLKAEGGGLRRTAEGADTFNGTFLDGTRVALWWAVDRDQVATLGELVLPEGAPYVATVEFDWRHRDCHAKAEGHAVQAFEDFVQASVDASAFEAAGEPSFEADASGAGFAASYRVATGLDVEVTDVDVKAVVLAPARVRADASGAAPGLDADVSVGAGVPLVGLATFPRVATVVGDAEGTRVTPRDTLTLRSAAQGSAAYATSGALLPPGFAPDESLVVLLVTIEYRPQDPTLGAGKDVFAHAVVRGE